MPPEPTNDACASGAAITVLICTHNRADLLERVIDSLNAAERPRMPVRILVAANACSDDTVARMRSYQTTHPNSGRLPLELLEVPTPGKSHALNAAIPRITTELVAFVDDDHRVDSNYLCAIETAASLWPETELYCGRILPDWDGSEPGWVHDEGPYRIYPLPVPRYDQGDAPKAITATEGPIPGGGNLAVRSKVFSTCGLFSTELGPHGHDLGGGEDSEYVLRALERGMRCQYYPGMIQFHYVDNDRLTLPYLIRKGYQRTRSTARIHGRGKVPLYMWRKLGEYAFHSTFCLSWAKRRFFLVRTAAAMGELQGSRESGHRGRGLNLPADALGIGLWLLALLAVGSGVFAWVAAGHNSWSAFLPAAGVAAAGTLALLWKSIADFSRTGPTIRDEILAHYRRYSVFALARLGVWSFLIMLVLGSLGVLCYYMLGVLLQQPFSVLGATLAATLGIAGTSLFQFTRILRFNPGLLVASMHYRTTRLHPFWRWATAKRIRRIEAIVAGLLVLLLASSTQALLANGDMRALVALWATVTAFLAAYGWVTLQPEVHARRVALKPKADRRPPNIVMIGSDTLRADRLGVLGYARDTTPHLDRLSTQGTLFPNCYVPCARTAPSLVSLFTGTWPQTHGIRDNFVGEGETRLKAPALPEILKALGYNTAAVSDWCGADLAKFSFGFDLTDLPEDQWNLKYLLRQGPKDLRLFISAFTQNRLGRLLLPELFYLGGAPLTSDLGRRARRTLRRLAETETPFLLNIFYSTTHPPFASEWPWYERYTDPSYDGNSRFAMAKLTDPFEIIRRQGAPKEEFDLDQIIDLYDGCVAQFDNEVGKLLTQLETSGIAANTIVVVYSDHGMEFFEHDTWGQGNSVIGDHSTKIPLIIRAPDISPRGVDQQIVRSIDLAPTLLEMIGTIAPPSIEGSSLVPALKGESSTLGLAAYNETGLWLTRLPGMHVDHLLYPNLLELLEVPDKEAGTLSIKPEFKEPVIRAKDRMIRHEKWKLVVQPLSTGIKVGLYDLSTDPECRIDLLASHREVGQALWLRLMQLCHDELPNPPRDNAAMKPGTTHRC